MVLLVLAFCFALIMGLMSLVDYRSSRDFLGRSQFPDPAWASNCLVLGGLLAALLLYRPVVIGLTKGLIRPLVRRSFRKGRNALFLGRHSVTITPEGFRGTGDHGESYIKWTAVERVVNSGSHVFFYVAARSAVVIPRRAFAGEDQFLQFVDATSRFQQAGADALAKIRAEEAGN
jgi:hypothetical protein